MSFLNRTINKIDTTISRAWGGINRSSAGIKAASASRSVVNSTRGIAAGSYATGKSIASDVVTRSGINSAKGWGMVLGGVAVGSGVGAYRANSRGDNIDGSVIKGALIGGGLAAAGILGGGAYKSARGGLLGSESRKAYAGMRGATSEARTQWGARSIMGKYNPKPQLMLPATASPSRYRGFS